MHSLQAVLSAPQVSVEGRRRCGGGGGMAATVGRPAASDRFLAVCGGVAAVWKSSAGTCDVTIALPDGESASVAAWHPTQGWLVVGTLAGRVHVMSPDGQTILRTLEVSPGAAVRALCMGLQGRFIWASGDGMTIVCFDLQGNDASPLKTFRVRAWRGHSLGFRCAEAHRSAGHCRTLLRRCWHWRSAMSNRTSPAGWAAAT